MTRDRDKGKILRSSQSEGLCTFAPQRLWYTGVMIRVADKTEVLHAFRAIDRDHVWLPVELKFPFILRDYMAWMEPSGHRTYLLLRDPLTEKALGVVFKQTHASDQDTAKMCEWCHRVRKGDAVRLLVAAAGDRRQVGLHLCRDLSCKDTTTGTPGIHDLRESLNPEEKLRRILVRMTEFVRRNLF